MQASTGNQTVGTAQLMVTPSFSISSIRLSGSRCGPGRTNLQPAMAAVYGSPHPLAWNMGEQSNATSYWESPQQSGSAWQRVCRTCVRCEYKTPLGLPVVPDV